MRLFYERPRMMPKKARCALAWGMGAVRRNGTSPIGSRFHWPALLDAATSSSLTARGSQCGVLGRAGFAECVPVDLKGARGKLKYHPPTSLAGLVPHHWPFPPPLCLLRLRVI